MWKQKDEEEVKEIRQRKKNAYKKIWRPGIVAVLSSIVEAIVIKIGFPVALVPKFHPLPWGEFFEDGLLRAFIFGLLVLFVTYAGQIVLKRRIFSGPEVLMCLKCNKYKNDDKNYICDCGGEFVPLDELEWVDEKNE